MRVFIDTNLWAYRLDRREATKSERVRGWLAEVIADHEVVISTQVLIELRSVASCKLQPPLGGRQITDVLAMLWLTQDISLATNRDSSPRHDGDVRLSGCPGLS